MDDKKIYDEIISSFQKNGSVQDTSLELGVSRNTVQRVLLTEGLWESERSREVSELVKLGYTTQQIADKLFLSVKCVQNYMPYTKGMYQLGSTFNSRNSKVKRRRMELANISQVIKQRKNSTNQTEEGIAVKEMKETHEYIELGDMDYFKKGKPQIARKQYLPSIFKLRFELVGYYGDSIDFSKEDRDLLSKYAKMKDGFIREVYVPSDMSLNALNYMIQRLYGWQNSHLHEFSLTEEDFTQVTKGGSVEGWLDLCGVCFRFPNEDYEDQYCGDDYSGRQSFKTWLRSKYTGTELPFSVGDTYIDNHRNVEDFKHDLFERECFKGVKTVDELNHAVDMGGETNKLLERLFLSDLLIPTYSSKPEMARWLEAVYKEKDWLDFAIEHSEKNNRSYLKMIEMLADLRERRVTQADMERIVSRRTAYHDIPRTKAEHIMESNKKVIDYLVDSCRNVLTEAEPRITPFVDTILYRYDFGDGWCVKITCEDGFYFNDSWDNPNDAGLILPAIKRDAVYADRDFYSCADNSKVSEEQNELFRKIITRHSPVCTFADGMCLLDDVGGIHGFADMLNTIHGGNKEEAEEMREWASSLGWSGRMGKPENML